MKNIFKCNINWAITSMFALLLVFLMGSNQANAADTQQMNAAIGGTSIFMSSVDVAYDRAIATLKKSSAETGLSVGSLSNPILRQTKLRVEVFLDATTGSYVFDVNKSGSNLGNSPTELKLDRKEIFFAQAMKLEVVKATQDPANSNKSKTLDINCRTGFTYADPAYFNFVDGDGNQEWAAIEAIFSTVLSFSTGDLTRVKEFPTDLLKFVPQKQFEWVTTNRVAENGDKTEAVVPSFPSYGPTDAERGYYRLKPGLVIDGASPNNEFTMNIPGGSKPAIGGDRDENGVLCDNVMVLEILGWVYSGSSSTKSVCNV